MEPSEHASQLPAVNLEKHRRLVPEAREEEWGPGLEEYLAILRRRKVALLLPMVILFAFSVGVAFGLPAVYRSTATILIEQQQIPPDLVRSTVTSYADERIQVITQRVLTTANLSTIIEKFNLYADQRKREGLDVVVERMRDDFDVKTVSANVRGLRGGRAGRATIAFNISYDSRSPTLAQRVANKLVSLYLEENLKTRTQAASDTVQFLAAEADRLGAEISGLDAKIAAFKQAHLGRLPEQLDLNLQLMERTEQQLLEVERQIRSLEERKILLEAAMAQVNATSRSAPQGTSADERLQALRVEYVGLVAVYSAEHPDVVRMRKEIEALEREVGTDSSVAALQARLEGSRADLAAALGRYSPQHPDVKKLEREVVSLEAELKTATAIGAEAPSLGSRPKDPAYIELQTQRRLADRRLQTLRAQQTELRAKFAVYEKRVSEIPQIELEYLLLVRDRDNLMAKYQEITAKRSSARVAEALEKDRKSERFSLIEPPQLPSKPFKPNRMVILALGLTGSVFGGLGTATVSELLNKAVHGARSVAALLGAHPLAVIPYIETSRDRRRRRWRRCAVVLSFLAMLAAAAAFLHFRIMPLDLLWAKVLARLGAF